MKLFRQLPILAMAVMISGCGAAGASGSGFESEPITTESQTTVATDQNEDAGSQQAPAADERINEDQALSAIKNYCIERNPDLQKMVDEGEYNVGWELGSTDDSQIIVVFRSYTGAIVRYYIDPVSGDTYVTEFVEGITPEEERTDESFNVRDYMD